MVGAETAEYLADRLREVTIVEMLDTIAADMPATPRAALLRRLQQLGVKIVTGTEVEAITDLGILVQQDGQQAMLEGSSSYFLALRSEPNDDLFSGLSGEIQDLHIAGDARQVARIVEATAQAAELALQI